MHKTGGWHARLSVLGASFLISAGLTALEAAAQESEPDAAQADAQENAASAGAGSTRARQLKLDEVVVTAQKRSQDVQEVPISVTSVSGEEIRDMNLQGLSGLSVVMPNATLAVSPTFSTVYVRGIGTGLNDGFEASVGLYVDNIYMGRQTYLNDALIDVQSVELLRGPQGTLFGKNTVAGALQVTNTVPTYEWEGSLDVMLGGRESRRATGVVNMPVIKDKLALRVSAQRHTNRGSIYNEFRDVHELKTDKLAGRIKARFDVTNNFYITAAFEKSHVKDSGQGFELLIGTPLTDLVHPLFDPTAESDPDRVTHTNSDNFADRKTTGANINAFWYVAGHELALIAGYNQFDEKLFYDADAGPIPLLSWDNDDSYAQWQAELRVVSPPGDIEYVGGLFFFANKYNGGTVFRQFDDDNLLGSVASGLLPPALTSALGTLLDPILQLGSSLSQIVTADALFQDFEQTSTTYAIYGQLTYRPWTWLEVIGGLRGHYENKEATTHQEFENTGLVLNAAFGTVEYDFNGSKSETDLTPKLAVRYLLNDTINIYGTIAKGYKAGGYTPTAPDETKTEFEPETSWTYELGIKSELWNRRIIANLAAFRTEFTDMQISVLTGAGEGFFVDNAASSTVQGFEWDIKALLWEGNLVAFAGGYLHAYYNNFELGPCQAGEEGNADGFCDMSGERLVRAPSWDITASFKQALPLGNLPFALFVGVDWNMFTSHFTDLDNDPNTANSTTHILNAQLGIGDLDRRWVLTANVHNALDTTVKGGVTDVPLFEGAYFGILAPGRLFTAEFRLTL